MPHQLLSVSLKSPPLDCKRPCLNLSCFILESQVEEEKEALLRGLREKDARFGSERKRQLELAKLKREQRRLKQEDNFDTAAVLFGLAKQEQAAREAK